MSLDLINFVKRTLASLGPNESLNLSHSNYIYVLSYGIPDTRRIHFFSFLSDNEYFIQNTTRGMLTLNRKQIPYLNDTESSIQPIEILLRHPRCECGAAKVDSLNHSSWCPKH